MPSILDDLTPQQHAAAVQPGPTLVIAGAGTGKTKTLTAAVVHRIANLKVKPSRILAVTFTNKAAAEMTGRVKLALGETMAPNWAGTFHGLGARQLRIEPEVADLRPGFDILDADDTRRMIKRVMKAMNLHSGEDGAAGARDPIKIVCNRISKWKDDLVIPRDAPAAAETAIIGSERDGLSVDANSIRTCARVYQEYQRVLQDANAADFGDLLLWPVRAMMQDRTYRERWSGRFDRVLADEYQDVNRAQYTWLRVLSAGHKEIFAVGDDDQSIFGWRGADITYIRRFARDFAGAAQIRLEENFRSTGHILAAANGIIGRDHRRLGKVLFTRKTLGTPIEVVRFTSGEVEAAEVTREIIRHHAEGKDWGDFAILYRSNALSRLLEEALMRGRVPYTIVGDVGFYHRAEIKDALALLRLVVSPEDRQSDESLRRVINTPARGFGAKAMTLLEQEAAWRRVSLLQALETVQLPPKTRSAGLQFSDAIRNVGRQTGATVADLLSLVLDAAGYRKMLRDSQAETTEGRLDNVQELIQLAGSFHTPRELLDHSALSSNGPGEDAVNTVKLLTLHRAKGLEFPHVFLVAWENGLFPPLYGDHDEERRLAYVGVTRGMKRVTISHASYRRGPATPSCFLEDIPDSNRVEGWHDHRALSRPAFRAVSAA
jgi:DNA helicase II / ATP-dependent DNA helicase PcrA